MISFGDPLAEVLVDAGVITRDQLEKAATARATNGVERLDETIARLGLAREVDIYSAVARKLGSSMYRKSTAM